MALHLHGTHCDAEFGFGLGQVWFGFEKGMQCIDMLS